jgi:hypothetical protein
MPLRVNAVLSKLDRWIGARLAGAHKVLPDVVIIGAAKSGSTTIYDYLNAHPQVLRSYRKEHHYFDRQRNVSSEEYRGEFPLRATCKASNVLTGNRPLTFEATPSYLFCPLVPARMQACLPDGKFVAVLREPVARAYSHYQMNLRKGYIGNISFREAIDLERRTLESKHDEAFYLGEEYNRQSYLGRGLYVFQLKRWFGCFPRDRFLILNATDLARDSQAAFEKLTLFLGIGPHFPGRHFRSNVGAYEPMNEEVREELACYFKPYNEELYELLQMRFEW